MPERQLGGYQLLRQLAVGGMAEIYVAKTGGVGGFEKLVALKVIHPNYSEDPEFVEMLVDEAKLAVQLQHANVVQTFDLGSVDEQYYIAMELIDGIDLYRLLRRASEKDVDFPFEVATFIAQEAANGLDYAHRKRDDRGRPMNIVHRDISPQNILLSFDGEVKICDFGIAKASRRAKQTAAGVIKGKYYYMSPEQAWGDPIDARTDIFSAGILLYEMLVGQMLYLEEDMDVLLDKVRKAQIAKPSTKRKGVPLQLESVVMKALSKRPQDRYQTAGELATALGRFLRAHAPDFNRARLAAWVHEVVGGDPTDRTQRDPKISTAVRRDQIARDEHSLIFKLKELEAQARAELAGDGDEPPTVDGEPTVGERKVGKAVPKEVRNRDVSTAPVEMPDLDDDDPPPSLTDLKPSLGGAQPARVSDYDENDATIVDSSNETLMAMAAPRARTVDRLDDERDPEDSTRPMAPGLRDFGGALGPLDDDPAADDMSTLDQEEEQPTDRTTIEKSGKSTLPLPGVRQNAAVKKPPQGVRQNAAAPVGARKSTLPLPKPEVRPPRPAPRSLPSAAKPPAPSGDEVDTDERDLKPTMEMRAAQKKGAAPQKQPDAAPYEPSSAELYPPSAQTAIPERFDPFVGGSSFEEPTGMPKSLPGKKPITVTSGTFDWPPLPPTSQGIQPYTPEPPTGPTGPTPPRAGESGLGGFTDAIRKVAPERSRTTLMVAGGALALAAMVALVTWPSTPSKGAIEVVSSPAGAEVRLDGALLPRATPLVITDVDPSRTHKVEVSQMGHDSWTQEVRFVGDVRQVRLQAVLTPIVGTLDVTSQPEGAEVIVNGRIRGVTPATVGDLSPQEEVSIELRLRGFKVARKTLAWQGKRRLEVAIPLEKAR